MRYAVLCLLLLSAGCEHRPAVAGTGNHAATAVNDRIGAAAHAEAKADVEKTPEAKAEAKAEVKAIDRQQTAEERSKFFEWGSAALFVVCIAIAIRAKFPLLSLPMDVIATGCGSFAALTYTLRVLLPILPYVVVLSGIVAIIIHWRHSLHLQTVATDVAGDARSGFLRLRGKAQDIVDRLRDHLDHHETPHAAPLAPVSVITSTGVPHAPEAPKG